MQNFDHNIGFWEKRQFFRRKLSKIAENCDHNIDPRLFAVCALATICCVQCNYLFALFLRRKK
jgi:hypothetical protein